MMMVADCQSSTADKRDPSSHLALNLDLLLLLLKVGINVDVLLPDNLALCRDHCISQASRREAIVIVVAHPLDGEFLVRLDFDFPSLFECFLLDERRLQ